MYNCLIHLLNTMTEGKTAKTEVLPGFCRIECSDRSGGTLAMWTPLLQTYLPKFYSCGLYE